MCGVEPAEVEPAGTDVIARVPRMTGMRGADVKAARGSVR
jgi:hypothetical protein